MYSPKETALILPGGGARGSFQAGVLETLIIHKQFNPGILRGVSVGALNTSILAQASLIEKRINTEGEHSLRIQMWNLKHLWLEKIISNKSIYTHRWLGYFTALFGADSIFKINPLKNILKENIDINKIIKSSRDLEIGTTSYLSGEYKKYKPTNPNFLEKILASASIPIIFPPVIISDEKEVLVDGGLKHVLPSAIKSGAKDIYIILNSPIENLNSTLQYEKYEDYIDKSIFGFKVNIFKQLTRVLDIILDQILLSDIKQTIKINEFCQKYPEIAKEMGKRYINLHIIAPKQKHGKDNSGLDFSKESIIKSYEHGQSIGKNENLWFINK